MVIKLYNIYQARMLCNRSIMLTLFYIVVLIVILPLLQPSSLRSASAEMDNTAQATISTSVGTNSAPSNLKPWCIGDFNNGCFDMSNNLSTYGGIIVGAVIGGVITWWVYNRQNKTASKQDDILHRIEEIEQKNRKILLHLEAYAKHHDLVLNKIILLNENMQALNQEIQNMRNTT